MRLKLFENYKDGEFEDIIGKDAVEVDIYKDPLEYRGAYVRGGKVGWSLDVYPTSSGYKAGSPKLNYLYLILEVEDEDSEDSKEIEIEISGEELQEDQFSSEIRSFPLYLRGIEIVMGHTKDPEFWKYKLIIGREED